MRRRTSVVVIGAWLALCAIPALPAQPALAAAGDPFPSGASLVFVSQGDAPGTPTTLYQVVQDQGATTFVKQGTGPAVGHNAVGFHEPDMYLYGINDNNALVRIGQGGAVTNLGQVGLPSLSANFNQGFFGLGAEADILYVRAAQSDRFLYAVNVVTRKTTRLTMSDAVLKVSDIAYKDGFLWSVHGEGGRLYRIDPAGGTVTSWTLASLGVSLPANPYGAQWLYGNGNLGVSNNVRGTVYQLGIDNPGAATPTLRIVSTSTGPANSQNDGAAYRGTSVNLAATKVSDPTSYTAGEPLTYTITVSNTSTAASSGWSIEDTLPSALSGPATTPGCAVTGNLLTCTGEALAGGASTTVTVTAQVPADATACIADLVTVTGFENDPNPADNTGQALTCPPGLTPRSFTVAKTVTAPERTRPGDTVTYTVEVTNTRESDYTDADPASFTDDLSGVLDDAVYDGDATGGTSVTGTTLTWSGALAIGATTSITYSVDVEASAGSSAVLRNAVAPSGSTTSAAPNGSTTAGASTLPGGVLPDTATAGPIGPQGTSTPGGGGLATPGPRSACPWGWRRSWWPPGASSPWADGARGSELRSSRGVASRGRTAGPALGPAAKPVGPTVEPR